MANPNFKATPAESRRMLLASLINPAGGLVVVCSLVALVKMHASWSYVGLGVGIAICAFGAFRLFVVTLQVKTAHQNDNPDLDGRAFDLRHQR
jgi:hypothetical protein